MATGLLRRSSQGLCCRFRGVGCIHYEMVTGRPMFPGSTVKEELHLIFRLLGEARLVLYPQCPREGSACLRERWPSAARGSPTAAWAARAERAQRGPSAGSAGCAGGDIPASLRPLTRTGARLFSLHQTNVTRFPLFPLPGTPTEETWPGITSNEEFKAYNFTQYRAQPLINHAPRYLLEQGHGRHEVGLCWLGKTSFICSLWWWQLLMQLCVEVPVPLVPCTEHGSVSWVQ